MSIIIPMHTIARILARHGLGRFSVEPLPGGQINASYLVDGCYVLRMNLRPEEHGKLAREQRVLAMLRDRVPVPETIAYDGSGMIIVHEYVIQTCVPGESLLARWGNAAEEERGAYIRQLADLMRRMHGIRLGGFGDPTGPRQGESWTALHARRAAHAVQVAREAGNAQPSLLDRAERALARDSLSLVGGYPSLTHGDLHFGNIHVQDGAITGILDYERAWAAAPDWELDQMFRFVHYPHLFADSGLEEVVHPSQFTQVIPGLRAAYPDLFAAPSLGARLRVYALEYDLRALSSVRKRHHNDRALVQAISQRIADTLSERFPYL
jgi:aminoglycoside phosphotransferase (APT) family kinase protein